MMHRSIGRCWVTLTIAAACGLQSHQAMAQPHCTEDSATGLYGPALGTDGEFDGLAGVTSNDVIEFVTAAKSCADNAAVNWIDPAKLVDIVKAYINKGGLPPAGNIPGPDAAFTELVAALVAIFEDALKREPDVRDYTRLVSDMTGYFACAGGGSVPPPGNDRDGDEALTSRDLIIAIAQERRCKASAASGLASPAELIDVAVNWNTEPGTGPPCIELDALFTGALDPVVPPSISDAMRLSTLLSCTPLPEQCGGLAAPCAPNFPVASADCDRTGDGVIDWRDALAMVIIYGSCGRVQPYCGLVALPGGGRPEPEDRLAVIGAVCGALRSIYAANGDVDSNSGIDDPCQFVDAYSSLLFTGPTAAQDESVLRGCLGCGGGACVSAPSFAPGGGLQHQPNQPASSNQAGCDLTMLMFFTNRRPATGCPAQAHGTTRPTSFRFRVSIVHTRHVRFSRAFHQMRQ